MDALGIFWLVLYLLLLVLVIACRKQLSSPAKSNTDYRSKDDTNKAHNANSTPEVSNVRRKTGVTIVKVPGQETCNSNDDYDSHHNAEDDRPSYIHGSTIQRGHHDCQ